MKNKQGSIGNVFRYTVRQHYKSPSVLILLFILFALAAASLPFIQMSSSKNSEVSSSDITTLYLYNETGFPLDNRDITADERYAELSILESDGDKEALRRTLHDNPTAAAAFLSADESGMGYVIHGYYGENSKISAADCSTLNNVLQKALNEAMLRGLNTTKEQVDTLKTMVVTNISTVEDYRNGTENDIDVFTNMMINYVYAYAVMILVAIAMSYIFQQCLEEKNSKLVESLLVSVSPDTLLAGKILAVTLFVFGGIGVVAAGFAVSCFIEKSMDSNFSLSALITEATEINFSALHLNVGVILLTILCVALAYFMLAFFAGIVGSCCSKTEDTQQASMAIMMVALVGVLSALFAPAFQSTVLDYVLSLFPLTGIFNTLPNYVCGRIPLVIMILSLVIQAATIFFFAKLAGKVYRMMLLYRGGLPKPAQLIRMLRENRAASNHQAKKEAEQ